MRANVKTHRPRSPRGFSLVELLMASVVVTGACLGLLAGFISTNRQVSNSARMMAVHRLLDIKLQSIINQNKQLIADQCWSNPSTPAASVIDADMGELPWRTEANPATNPAKELSTGSFYDITVDGMITPLSSAVISGNPDCSTAPQGTYCREYLISCGLPKDMAANNPNWASFSASEAKSYTVWARVWRVGDTSFEAVTHMQVVTK